MFLLVLNLYFISIFAINITTIGNWETIWNYTTEHCPSSGSTDNPNNSPRAFITNTNEIEFLDSSSWGYYQRRGSSFTRLKSICSKPVIKSGNTGPNAHPHDYYGYVWVQSTWIDPANKTNVYAIIHNEFHGNDQSDKQKWCPSDNKDKCWYASGLCAYSDDGGNTMHLYQNLTERVCFATPYKYVPNGGRQGISPFTNMLHSPMNDSYYYLWSLRQIPQNNIKHGLCLWRTNNLSAAATSWRAYNKTSKQFDIQSIDPYQYGNRTNPLDHICDISDSLSTLFRWSWSYNTVLNKYLSLGFDNDSGEVTYSVSSDIINWSKPSKITTMNNDNGKRYTYPSIIDSNSKGINFEYSNKNPYLYFAKGMNVKRDIIRIQLNIEP